MSDRTTLYDDAKRYDLEYSGFVEDLAFYLERAQPLRGPLLEIGCGTGRLTIPLAASGATITGLDTSDAMLIEARSKATIAGPSVVAKISWVLGEASAMKLDKRFAAIFFPFNTFQHLLEVEKARAFLDRTHEHLEHEGLFIFDVLNPKEEIVHGDPKEAVLVGHFLDPKSGELVRIQESGHYDPETQILKGHRFYTNLRTNRTQKVFVSIRLFFPEELETLLTDGGFEIEETLGDFDGSPFSEDSMKQIVVARKSSQASKRPRERT